jgi:copper chaperone NosL
MKSISPLLVALTLLVAACASAEASGPPDIKYGRDICVNCGMIISEARFATAYRTPGGEEKKFDDLGDMVVYGIDSGELAQASGVWVHDFETEEWTEATSAFYVPTLAAATPMGHGILAFSDRERAEQFATDLDGEVIDWATVVQLPISDGLLGAHHHEPDDDAMTHDEPMTDHDHEGGG